MQVPEELALAIKLAEEASAKTGKTHLWGKDMVRLLRAAAKQIESKSEAGFARSGLRGGDQIVYSVEKAGGGQGEVLSEYRKSGKSFPFRCPKAIYDSMVEVLVQTDRALSVEEIASAVEKVMGERPAEFQVRVVLRLFMHVDPALLIRSRARYRCVTADFRRDAAQIWINLRSNR